MPDTKSLSASLRELLDHTGPINRQDLIQCAAKAVDLETDNAQLREKLAELATELRLHEPELPDGPYTPTVLSHDRLSAILRKCVALTTCVDGLRTQVNAAMKAAMELENIVPKYAVPGTTTGASR